MYDFIHNDSLIQYDNNIKYLRNALGVDHDFLNSFTRFLREGSLDDYQWHDLRESVLLILEELVKVKHQILDLIPELKLALDELRANIDLRISAKPESEFNDMLLKEVELTTRVYAAQTEAPETVT